ncbi:MAG: hypothetical protein ACI9SC_001818 [Gammaproteobacteria bacterium]|jgi:hypothetical protein
MLSRILFLTNALLLASCVSIDSTELCLADGKNLIEDASFSSEAENNLSRLWSQSQHAGELSFNTKIQKGVLTISKVGTQPWFTYKQVLQAEKYAGQKIVFSADLKLDLDPPRVSHGFGDGGGLMIVAKSANRKLVLRSVLEHEPHIGKTDWQKVQVIVQLPENTRWLTLAFLHQADGIMQVRNPFFGTVAAEKKGCAVTGGLGG